MTTQKISPNPKFFFNHSNLLKIIYFLFFLLTIFGLSKVANQTNNVVYEASQINFKSNSSKGYLNLLHLKRPSLLLEATINFEFVNHDPSYSYGNIFQTSSEANGIRLELQPGKKLFLIIGNNRLFLIADHLLENVPYKVSILYKDTRDLRVKLNGETALTLSPLDLNGDKLQIQNFSIGSGYALSRSLNGVISNFSATVQYRQITLLGRSSHWILLSLVFLGLTLGLKIVTNIKKISINSISQRLPTFTFFEWVKIQFTTTTAYLFYPLTLALLTVTIWPVQFYSGNDFGLTKWIPYLTLPFSLLAICTLRWIAVGKVSEKSTALITASLIIYTGFLLFISFRSNGLTIYLLFFSLLSICSLHFLNLKNKAIISIICMVSWVSILNLDNWVFLSDLLRNQPFPYLLISSFTLIFIFSNLLIGSRGSNSSAVIYLLTVLGLCIFLFLSFRTDTLFIPGSEYHWEYFTGPIRTIRNGGLLLFDAPSQYGFMNILLASTIYINSSWHSFYIFQGLILFAISTTTLLTLLSFHQDSSSKMVIVFLLVLGSFFFADPHWIGPLPFPSSSVTRFFCCYLLIFSTLIQLTGIKKKIILSISWCIGVLWSAESAFYCTSIYFFVIVADTLSSSQNEEKKCVIKDYLIISLSILLATIIFISVFYFIKIGRFPSFISYFDFAIGYASGYGYVSFPINGPGNLLLLIFLGVGIMLCDVIKQMKKNVAMTFAAIAGCIWAVASYYLGRPVPQNITALFPLLTFCTLLSLSLASRYELRNTINPLFVASTPLYFLILATYYSPSWWQQLEKIQSLSTNISLHLPKSSSKLESELKRINPNGNIPIVNFSDSAATPYFSTISSLNSEESWLPAPLQLLMPPISEEKQALIMKRFICLNFKQNGILIYHPGSISYAWPIFLKNLNQFLLIKNVTEVDDRKIYLFERNTSFDSLCNINLK
jgi:hypothetical protein